MSIQNASKNQNYTEDTSKIEVAKVYTASAPASLKLLGEYAVLFNQPAIVCAANRRITAKLEPRSDDTIFISSSLGSHTTNTRNISIVKPLQFVLATLKHFSGLMPSGCNIVIESEFSDTVGLGSSAATTVACVAVIVKWLGLSMTNIELLRLTHEIVLEIQSVASGADLAASIFGGVISYQKEPLEVVKLTNIPEITLVYSGGKTTTSVSVSRVDEVFSELRDLQSQIHQAIGACSRKAVNAIQEGDWVSLGKLFNIHHGLQEALCSGTAGLSSIVYKLREYDTIFGAKISGSGFGDCAVALGKIPPKVFPQNELEKIQGVMQIPVTISKIGYKYHE